MNDINKITKNLCRTAFKKKIVPTYGRDLVTGDLIHELGIVCGEIKKASDGLETILLVPIHGREYRKRIRPNDILLVTR